MLSGLAGRLFMIFSSSRRVPLVGAHRGASCDAPENTSAAFDLAVRQGAELIELDVHLSADRCLVVHHDFDLLRTAGCAGRIGDLDLGPCKSSTSARGAARPTEASGCRRWTLYWSDTGGECS